MSAGRALVLLLAVAALVAADLDVPLGTPLTTRVRLPFEPPLGAATFTATVHVPEGAPADLGLALVSHDRQGRWRQANWPAPLPPGEHRILLHLPATDALPPAQGEALAPGEVVLLAWGSRPCRERLRVRAAGLAVEAPPVRPARLLDLRSDPPDIATGAAWTCSLRPSPSPIDGFDRDALACSGRLIADGETQELRVRTVGGRVVLRGRPAREGAWTLALAARWRDGRAVAADPVVTVRARGAPPPPDPRVVRLRAPLATDLVVPCPAGPGARVLRLDLEVPDEAPDDLCAIGFVRDADGAWRQAAPRPLTPGSERLALLVPARADHDDRVGAASAGVRLVSARAGDLALVVGDLRVEALPPPAPPCLLRDARIAGWDARRAAPGASVGGPWTLVARAPGVLAVARVGTPDGRTMEVPCMREGDRVSLALHPLRPGAYPIALEARWPGASPRVARLPPLAVVGQEVAGAVPVALTGPLGVRLRCAAPAGIARVAATVHVPDDAPRDLGVAAWVSDRHGRWYQSAPRGPLAPGRHRLEFDLSPAAEVAAIGHGARWTRAEAAKAAGAGIVLWTATPSRVPVLVEGPVAAAASPRGSRATLLDLAAIDGAPAAGRTGERWSLAVRPVPFPANPFAAGEFTLDLVVRPPGGPEQRIPGFFQQDMARSDGGDRERVAPTAPGRFAVRFRPRQPGRHQLRLEARWSGGAQGSVSVPLPPLEVAGQPWDEYARVDARDPRFLAVAGRPFWPVGLNLRSVWDVRSRQRLQTRLTPDRGTFAYDAYLDRAAAAGIGAVEIWLSSWNLALEWRADWPGYHGIGRYNEENAWRLDQVLERAWSRGIRVNLVINNHGQASSKTDTEWANNPWNVALGGPLADAAQLFSDPRALAGQADLRRYLIARYADHPAILGWKLWSEQDLTDGRRVPGALATWHRQAVAEWKRLDAYAHPVTSHWCGNYRHVDPAVGTLLDYVCIDAYHGWDEKDRYRFLPALLEDSTLEPDQGLARLGRPVLVTEFGGSSGAGPPELVAVDHAVGGWSALVTGHAGSPMLWWFEWVDQGERWSPYRALSRFVAGEDLRGADAKPVAFAARGGELWARGWSRPGRILGYVLDREWAATGGDGRRLGGVAVVIGEKVAAGAMQVEWWDADRGERIARGDLRHAGGPLVLTAPPFQRHLAFKLVRGR